MRAQHGFSKVRTWRSRGLLGVALAGALVAEMFVAASAAATPPAEEPSGAEAGQLTAPDMASAATIAQLEGQPVEVIGERTEASSTWALPNGTFASSIAAGPIWVQRGGDGTQVGDWAEVDLTLEKDSEGRIRPKAHPADLVLADAGVPDDGQLLSMERGGESVVIAWDGDLPEPRLEGPRAIYAQVEPGVDLVVEATRTGYEQFFVLTERPDEGAAPELALTIQTEGLTAEEAADGAVAFIGENGDVVAVSGTPQAWDAAVDGERLHPLTEPWSDQIEAAPMGVPNAAGEWATGDPQRVSESQMGPADATLPPAATEIPEADALGQASEDATADAKSSLALPLESAGAVTAPDTAEFTLTPEEEFLQDDDTAYPVVIDPEVMLLGWFDTWVQTGVTSDQSGSTELRVGTYNGGNSVARSFLNVHMEHLKYKHILNADLLLLNFYSSSCTARGWEVWTTGVASTSTRMTDQPAWVDRWGYSTQTRGYSSSCAGGWVGADVTNLLQAWSDNGRGVVGMGLKANNESDNLGWKKFISANAGEDYLPHINVIFNTPPLAATGFKVSGQSNGWTNTVTPQLSAVARDADRHKVDLEFMVYNAAGSRLTTLTAANVLSGFAGTVNVPSGLLAHGKTYSVVVRSKDDHDANKTNLGPETFTVDTTEPAAPDVTSLDYPDDGDWYGEVRQPGAFTFDLLSEDETLSRFEWKLNDDPVQPEEIQCSPSTSACEAGSLLRDGAGMNTETAYGGHLASANIRPISSGRQELRVYAVDKAGNESPTVTYIFYVGRGGLAAPNDGASVAQRVRLVPDADDDLTQVKFQWRRGPDLPYIADVDLSLLTRADGSSLSTNADGTERTSAWSDISDLGGYATWDARSTLGQAAGPLQVRALLAADASGNGAFEGEWITVIVDPDADYAATEAIGPGEVNLLTGDYTLASTDVDELGLSVGRTASSRDPNAGLEPQSELLSESQQQMSGLADISSVNATTSISVDRWHAGSDSLRIRPTGGSPNSYAYPGPSGDIGLKKGRRYRASGWLHVPSATGLTTAYQHGLKLTAWAVVDGTTTPIATSETPTKTGTFQQLSIDFTVPAHADDAFIRLYNGFDDPDRVVYWDDVSVKETWAPLGPEWTLGVANGISSSSFSYIDEPAENFAAVHLSGGGKVWFTSFDNGTKWRPVRGAESLTLVRSDEDTWRLTSLNGTVSVFSRHHTGTKKFELTTTSPSVGSGQARMVYEKDALGRLQLRRIIAPVEPGVDGWPTNVAACTGESLAVGCRVLELIYSTTTTATGPSIGAFKDQLRTVRLYSSDDGAAVTGVEIARYGYDADGRLREVFDPRISPGLKSTYEYDADGRVTELTPPGELPWSFRFGVGGSSAAIGDGDVVDRSSGRLYDVSRPSLAPGTNDQVGPDTTTTVVYDVPLTRLDGGPHNLGPADLATWDQHNAPSDATAIFGPEDVPGLTTASASTPGPDGYGHAVVHYLDASGREVNLASPAGPDAPPAGYIQTNEYDEHGDVVRALSAGNRLLALGQVPSAEDDLEALGLSGVDDTAARARALSTYSTYDDEGVNLLRERGPRFTTAIGNDPDEVELGHRLTTYLYDEGTPDGAAYNLVTTETTAFLVAGSEPEELLDVSVTKRQYDPIDGASATGPTSGWKVGAPTAVIADAGPDGANLTSRTRYDQEGRVMESRHVGSNGNDARTTITTYYTPNGEADLAQCDNKPAWSGFLCSTRASGDVAGHDAARMAGTLPVNQITDYDRFGMAEVLTVSATGPLNGITATQSRTVTTTFDAASRPMSYRTTTAGPAVSRTAMPIARYDYDPATGRSTAISSVDPTDGTTVLSTIGRSYDELGRMTRYTDADGGWTDYTYDAYGKPTQLADSIGTTHAISYDRTLEPRGMPTSVTDSVAGTFTASYGPDGELIEQSMPGGVELRIGYDSNRSAISRSYVRSSDDVVIAFSTIVENANSQWLAHTTNASDKHYTYDNLGRLTDVHDTVAGACTWRRYEHNQRAGRTGMQTTFSPSSDCADPSDPGTATVGSVGYTYDSADRLVSDTVTGNDRLYDPLGRLVSAPASSAPGATVETAFFASDMVAAQTIDGVAQQTFELDPSGRFRSSTAAGWSGSAWAAGATTVNHYASDADSPSWIVEDTSEPNVVTRYVTDMEGQLALQTSTSGDRVLVMTDLHGDVMATLSLEDDAAAADWTSLAYQATDEFGNATDLTTGARLVTDGSSPGADGRYGWLGGKQRSADALGGVFLMGARLYDPATGRFQSIDSVPGGNATEYDYCASDPVNCVDLTGRYVTETLYDKGSKYTARGTLLVTGKPNHDSWNQAYFEASMRRDAEDWVSFAEGFGTVAKTDPMDHVRHFVVNHRAAITQVGAFVGCIASAGFGCALATGGAVLVSSVDDEGNFSWKSAVVGAVTALPGLGLTSRLAKTRVASWPTWKQIAIALPFAWFFTGVSNGWGRDAACCD